MNIDSNTMQAIGAVAVLVIALIAIAKIAQPVMWLWNQLFGNFARKQEVKAVADGLATMRGDIAEMVTRREYEHHNNGVAQVTQTRDATVNKVLDLHQKNISEAHERVDDLKDAMNKGFSDIKDLLLDRLPKT